MESQEQMQSVPTGKTVVQRFWAAVDAPPTQAAAAVLMTISSIGAVATTKDGSIGWSLMLSIALAVLYTYKAVSGVLQEIHAARNR
jgi:hypothetical protein